jgi:hypothetical protein
MLSMILFGLGGLLLPEKAFAFIIAPPEGGGGSIVDYLARAYPILKDIFMGVLTLMIIINAGRMIIGSYEESAMGEAKSSFAHLVLACVVVALAELIAATVTETAGFHLFTAAPLIGPATNLSNYFKYALFGALIVNIVIQAFRLITAHGEEEYVSRARKRLIFGFVGAIIVILADLIVGAVTSGTGLLLPQIVNLSNFLLLFIGVGATIGLIIGGILYVISIDESLKEKGKGFIKVSIITLIVVLLAAILVNAAAHIASGA